MFVYVYYAKRFIILKGITYMGSIYQCIYFAVYCYQIAYSFLILVHASWNVHEVIFNKKNIPVQLEKIVLFENGQVSELRESMSDNVW